MQFAKLSLNFKSNCQLSCTQLSDRAPPNPDMATAAANYKPLKN